MPREFVIDACSFKLFYDELLAEIDGAHRQALNSILAVGTVILDFGGHVRQEWLDTCCGELTDYLNQWIINRMVESRIQERHSNVDAQVRSRLRAMGMPRSDQKYVYLAHSNSAYAIVSDDIDFYDPKEKGRGACRIVRIKSSSLGAVASYLRKELRINIFMLENTNNYLK